MRYMRYICLILLIVLVLGVPLSLGMAGTLQFVPDSCFSVVSVSNVKSDRGVSWLINAWINSPRKSPLRDLLNTVPAQEVSVALFPAKDETLNMLLVVEFPKGGKIDKVLLDSLIETENGGSLRTVTHNNTAVTYTSAQDIENYAAYTMVGNMLLAASGLDILKKALDGPSVSRGDGYKSMMSTLSSGQDGILFSDNSGSQFVRFLRPLENKWRMSLLLAADYLQWMGASFDFVDSQRVSGQFLFRGADTSYIEDIKDDAEFMGETFKRKFIADKIDYKSDVQVDGKTVVLNLEISGLEPLWTKLFGQGVLSLFRVGEH
jgi:hypothetical protein